MKIIDKSVDVVALFTKDGVPKPLRFIYHDDDIDSYEVRKIKLICNYKLYLNKNKILVYVCKAVINNRVKQFELRFDIDRCTWTLYKI